MSSEDLPARATPSAPVMVLPSPERESGIPHAPAFSGLRSLLLRGVVGGMDLHAFIQAMRTTGDTHLRCRVILPADVLDRVRRGESTIKDARDGRGKVPWVADETGKITHQVRLDDLEHGANPTQLSLAQLAAGQAATHAMLADLGRQLERIDRKVDDLLDNHRFRWWADIEAGIELAREVPAGHHDDPRISEARQLLKRALHEGWMHVERSAKRLADLQPHAWHQVMLALVGMKELETTEQRGSLLQTFMEDLQHIVRGTEAIVRLYEHMEEWGRARNQAEALRSRLAQMAEDIGQSYRLAPRTPEQTRLLTEVMPALRRDLPNPDLVIETSVEELMALEASHAD